MSFKPFFRNSSIEETIFFDEGPRLQTSKNITSTNSSSIQTSDIDAFRQGVEITHQKHFDAGFVKIHAGNPGHENSITGYGMDKNFNPEPFFEEKDLFDPVNFLRAQEYDSFLFYDIITFPIITGDNDQMENYLANGIIEPFPIREIVSFFGIDAPYPARGVRGHYMSGNDNDGRSGSDHVVTIHEHKNAETIPFLDMPDLFINENVKLEPYEDKRYVLNFKESLPDADIQAAVSLMTGSTDNYISIKNKSATCGWDFTNNVSIGTDSIAFGGMVY